MTSDFLNDLKELRDAVNQSSEHTQRQIQSVESNTLLGAIISIIVALGISFQLKILTYWVPASFLLMYLWALYSLVKTKENYSPENINKNLEAYQKIEWEKLDIGFAWFFKNMSPLIKAVSLIYIITLAVLVLIANKTITTENSFSLLVPAITALLYAPMPFFFDNLSRFFERGTFQEILNRLLNIKEKVKPKGWRLILGVIKVIFLILYVLLVMFLPLWALFVTWNIVVDILFLGLVLVLQFITIILIASYFSSLSAKRELTNSLTNFADINYQINDAILSKEANQDTYDKLKTLYLTAKQYDLLIDDSLKYVNFYYLLMQRVHLKRKQK